MAFLVRGGTPSTATNPVLDLYTFVSGNLVDAQAVRFRIFDVTSEANKTLYFGGSKDLVQVFPTVAGSQFALNVTNLASDPLTPGHKLSTGHYFGPWEATTATAAGNYIIEWQYQQVVNGPFRNFAEEFVVINEGQILTGLNKIEKLKLFMVDFVTKNELLEELEYSEQQYMLALELALDKFNGITPMSCYTSETLPCGTQYLILMGGAAFLLRMTSHLQLRNQLSYTDGNIHVGLTDKHQLYLNASQTYMQEFEQTARAIKNTINNDSAWGESTSPLINANGSLAPFGGGWGWGDT